MSIACAGVVVEDDEEDSALVPEVPGGTATGATAESVLASALMIVTGNSRRDCSLVHRLGRREGRERERDGGLVSTR